MSTYYVDNVLGDDSNLGTSEGAGNAWQTIAKATSIITAGDTAYVKKNVGTPYSIGAAITFTNSGLNAGINLVGYGVTPGDKVQALLNGGSSTNYCFDVNSKGNIHIRNFEIYDFTSVGLYVRNSGSTHSSYENLKIHDCVNYGVLCGTGYHVIRYCEIYGVTNGIYGSNFDPWLVMSNYIHDCTGVGIGSDTNNCFNNRIVNNIIHTCPIGVVLAGSGAENVIKYNTIDGSTTAAIRLGNSGSSKALNTTIIRYNLITNSAIGIDDVDTPNTLYGMIDIDWNAYYLVTTPANGVLSQGSNAITCLVAPYTDLSTHDFSLNNTATGGASCRQAEDVVGLSDDNEIGTSYLDVGALQTQVVAVTTPTFGGITGLERVAPGLLKASWSAGTGTITGYKVFVRKGSAPSFEDTYLWGIVDNARTSVIIDTEEDNDTLLYGDGAIYVGVRAYNDSGTGSEETNTTTLNITPNGGLLLNNQQIQVLRID